MSRIYLGIDGGASSAKWCLVGESGEKLAEGKFGPIDGHIYRSESRDRLSNFLENIRSSTQYDIEGAHVGLTGSPESSDEQFELRKMFKEVLGVKNLTLENDVHLGYRAAFGDSSGLFLYAGTGSILIYQGIDGRLNRIGGWGYLLGDEGAGYWIGKEVIRSTLRALEEGRESPLSKFVFEAAQGTSWDKIKRFVYSTSREQIAQLAQPLLLAAESGSEDAKQIAINAGLELASLVRRAKRILGTDGQLITFSGGIAMASSIVRGVIEDEIGQKISLFSGDTALTAAQMARSKINF